MRLSPSLRILVLALGLTACAEGVQQGGRDPDDGGSAPTSMKGFFDARVQPRLDFCRTCHVSGGIADVEDGRDYMLSGDRAQDFGNLEASWSRLGGNNPTSSILLMASGQETPHTGGKPWPVDSEAYADVEKILACFEDPDGCTLDGGGGPVTERALLGSQHGGHAWFDFCATRDDAAVLPPDPRSLVQPGVNAGKAVHFNAFWRDCRKDPALIGEAGHPKTCGELRESWAIGDTLMRGNGGIGAGTFFAGSEPGGAFSITADDYNNLWRVWGLTARPDNFDQLVAERYGVTFGTTRNPYPKPGEDPNLTDGGTGQLPGSMTQTRNADGSWSGRIGLTCHGCHSGGAGTAADGPGLGLMYGSGNSLNDTGLTARELGLAARSPIAFFSLFGTSRGTNNASDVNIFFLLDGVRLDAYLLSVLTSGSTASGDTPAWWNMGHRPLKFQDGFFAADANRVDIIFYTPIGGDEEWVRAHAQPADHWIMSLKSPAYPMTVDTALAEQGAVLFHSKDLWAEGLDNPAAKPGGGNGSCASCHGAYSPRYVHDPAYLDDP
ncbi:MAG TPA: hypothetical protein VJM11_11980, partial [Nevskiaceae bacterium]|nr:hypothetical protein [Nevskiaceae bacterium]